MTCLSFSACGSPAAPSNARLLWLGVSIRCFKTSELGDALDWIDVPRELHPRFFDAVERLRRNQEVPGANVSIAD